MITVHLSSGIEQRLDHLAKRTGRTKSFHIREALLNHLEDLEDAYLGEQRLSSLHETVSLDQLLPEENTDAAR